MGSFSWTKADTLTNVANIVEDKPFRFLVPKGFGKCIHDYYRGYGHIGEFKDGPRKGFPLYDAYELVAFWNADAPYKEKTVRDYLKYDGDFPLMPTYSEYTDDNRRIGISICSNDYKVNLLKYPLKFVSASYKGSYEDCKGRSYSDSNQGWRAEKRNK